LAINSLSRALADCMELLQEGESLEACLERYPQYQARLRPLLQIAQALQGEQSEVSPTLRFLAELKSKLTQQRHEGR
jgi:hypothetical protein